MQPSEPSKMHWLVLGLQTRLVSFMDAKKPELHNQPEDQCHAPGHPFPPGVCSDLEPKIAKGNLPGLAPASTLADCVGGGTLWHEATPGLGLV